MYINEESLNEPEDFSGSGRSAEKSVLNTDGTINKKRTKNAIVQGRSLHFIGGPTKYDKSVYLSLKKSPDVCCQEMLRLANDKECPFRHVNSVRAFYLDGLPEGYFKSENQVDVSFQISHCIFCGKRFPVDLFDYRCEILSREFGLEMETEDGYRNPLVPSEFLTDAWWIARKNYSDFPTKNESWLDGQVDGVCDEDDKQDLGDFCCPAFKISVDKKCDRCPGNICSEYPIIYEPEKRRYRLTNIPPRYLRDSYYKRQPRRALFVNIFHCPRCGAKLPKSLASRWYTEINEKYGVFNILSRHQMAKVPEKYLTDAWWKELDL